MIPSYVWSMCVIYEFRSLTATSNFTYLYAALWVLFLLCSMWFALHHPSLHYVLPLAVGSGLLSKYESLGLSSQALHKHHWIDSQVCAGSLTIFTFNVKLVVNLKKLRGASPWPHGLNPWLSAWEVTDQTARPKQLFTTIFSYVNLTLQLSKLYLQIIDNYYNNVSEFSDCRLVNANCMTGGAWYLPRELRHSVFGKNLARASEQEYIVVELSYF